MATEKYTLVEFPGKGILRIAINQKTKPIMKQMGHVGGHYLADTVGICDRDTLIRNKYSFKITRKVSNA